jgi:hypothetical protein
MAQRDSSCSGQSWWIAVFVPQTAGRGAGDIFKITRVTRFQAQNKDIAHVQACRDVKGWKLVSVAREEVVVY